MYYCILFTASSGGNYHFLYSKQGREKIILVNYYDTHYDTVSKHGTALNGYNWLKVPVGTVVVVVV